MVIVQSEGFFDLFPKNKANLLKVIEISEKLKLKTEQYYQHLTNSYFPFDAMCWALAELQLILENGAKNYSENEVIKRAEKIFDSDLDYDTLCWLISRFKVYLEETGVYP